MVNFFMNHEILPGLGAFALAPTEDGDAAGAEGLTAFIQDVFDHIALQTTQHERSRYWAKRIHEAGTTYRAAPTAPFLTKPPADTTVLLGFVKNEAHLRWIHETLKYNLRADNRRGRVGLGAHELAADLVLLYGPSMAQAEIWAVDGVPEILTDQQMKASGYPNPQGSLYFCLPLAAISDLGAIGDRLTSARVQRLRDCLGSSSPYGAPVATTWLEVSSILSETDAPVQPRA